MTEQPSMDAPEFEYVRFLQYGTESDLTGIGIEYARAALPQWTPRAGNTEMVLMESLALMLGVEVMAIQLMPNQVVERLMSLYGIRRDQGQEATGRVRFTVTASKPIQVIPAQTRLRFYVDSTGETIDLLTVEPVSIITSETLTGEVNVFADLPGSLVNGTPTGTVLSVVDSNLPFIESAALTVPLAGGAGLESDNAYYGRAAAALSRLTSTLVSPESFQYAALTQPGIGRSKVFDLYDPATPNTVAAGHVTVAVAGTAGQALAASVMDELSRELESEALASLTVHVIAPTYTTVNLTVTVRATPGYSEQQVKDSVDATIRAWINPVTWDWTSPISQYAIIAAVASAAGVRSVTTAPADIPLPGKAPLPILGTLTVNVTA